MKKTYLYLAVAATLGLASCSSSSDDNENTNQNLVTELKPVKAAEVSFSTNGNDITTRVAPTGFQADAIYRQYGQYVETNVEIADANVNKTLQGIGQCVHMSMHIRANANPTITLPIPAAAYTANGVANNAASTTASYSTNIAGQAVSVTIAYNTNGITLTVSGMSDAVRDALEAQTVVKDGETVNAADGLNIDIRLYFNDNAAYNLDYFKSRLNNGSAKISNLQGVTYVVSKGYALDADKKLTTGFAAGICELAYADAPAMYVYYNEVDYTTTSVWKKVYSTQKGTKDPSDNPTHPSIPLKEVKFK